MEGAVQYWQARGGEFFYRPVAVEDGDVVLRPRRELRASWRDLSDPRSVNVIDARSEEEFAGDDVLENDPRGHIPGATNVPWREFVDDEQNLLVGIDRTRAIAGSAGIRATRPTVVYCRSGPRAAVVTLALLRAGYEARLYDGSWLDWCDRALPIETGVSTSDDEDPVMTDGRWNVAHSRNDV
jgi:thiosulfate/3-mercaptopyruvate sulfurtransferase